MHVRFGTDGWRGVIGGDFTFVMATGVASGLAALAHERGTARQGVVVGYDRRFLSEMFAARCAERLAARGVPVLLCSPSCPTPAVAMAIRDAGAAYGLVVTASHNPPEYNGIKLRGPDGAPLPVAEQRWVEDWLGRNSRLDEGSRSRPAARGSGPAAIRRYDPWPAYRDHVASLLDVELIRECGPGVIHDPMHGSAAGWVRRFLPQARQIRAGRDPLFGGEGPEPLPGRLRALVRRVRSAPRPSVGLATDGDGDRLAAITEDGRYTDSHHLLALLYAHIVENRGDKGRVVRTVTTSSMVDLLAAEYGLPVEVTPVGFVHIAERFARCKSPPAVIGGEESGGIGVARHLPERDAVFAALLLLEYLAFRRCSLSEAVRELKARVGDRHIGRLDVRCRKEPAETLDVLPHAPEEVGGIPVSSVQRLDGLTLNLDDGCRLHLRASRTEPILRLYAEASGQERLSELMRAGRSLALAIVDGETRPV